MSHGTLSQLLRLQRVVKSSYIGTILMKPKATELSTVRVYPPTQAYPRAIRVYISRLLHVRSHISCTLVILKAALLYFLHVLLSMNSDGRPNRAMPAVHQHLLHLTAAADHVAGKRGVGRSNSSGCLPNTAESTRTMLGQH